MCRSWLAGAARIFDAVMSSHSPLKGAAHLAEEQVAQDDEGPRPHVGAGLEALSRGPRLEQGLLDEVVGEIAAAGQGAAERAKVRNDRG